MTDADIYNTFISVIKIGAGIYLCLADNIFEKVKSNIDTVTIAKEKSNGKEIQVIMGVLLFTYGLYTLVPVINK